MKTRNQAGRRGAATLELAVVGVTLVAIGLGAVDFGRMYYESIAVAGAAETGALYGARSPQAAADSEAIRALLTADIGADAAVAADSYCDCPDRPGVAVACGTTCPGYGEPRMYIRTRVEKRFETLGRYPWIPAETPLAASSLMRVR